MSILILAFDPRETDDEVPLNPYLGTAKHLTYAAYQDKMSVESLVNQGWHYHLLRVGNAVWKLSHDDARFFYTLLGHPSFQGRHVTTTPLLKDVSKKGSAPIPTDPAIE